MKKLISNILPNIGIVAMKFTTQLELNITIMDPIAIYSTDYNQMLLDHAKIMYEGTCRNGQYIQSIDKIIKRSLPNVIKRDLTAKVRAYIQVEVSAIRYDRNDYITGLKIEKIINAGKIRNFDMIQCSNDHVMCLVQVSNNLDKFNVGDIIPVRVINSIYKIGNKKIAVNAYPFLPYIPDMVYYSVGKLSNDIKTYYEEMILPLFNREIERKNNLDGKRWKYFSDLMFPYKKHTSNKSNIINAMDLNEIQNSIIGIDRSIDMSDMKLVVLSNRKASDDITIITEDQKNIIIRITFEYLKWLSIINDLTEQCANDEVFQRLDYVWKMYEENKI